VKLSAIAQAINAGCPEQGHNLDIEGIASPHQAHERHITFLSHKRLRGTVEACRAVAVIVRTGESLPGKICLEVTDPYVGYAKVARLFEDKRPLFNQGIAKTAVVDSSAHLGEGTSIGPLTVIGQRVIIGNNCRIEARCVIEPDVSIGNDCRIDSGVVIRYGSRIGDRIIIQAGAIIGSDGFGNARENDRFIRIPCFGSVVIEDDAEIGANTTIDRGNFEPTIIRCGVKLDNLIHIAHNVEVGDDTAIAAQTGVSGSTRIGKQVLIGGQAGFVGHIDIGDNAFIGAKAGVSKSVKPGGKVTGYPARDLMTMRRIEASQAQLPELLKELKQLRNEIDAFKKHKDRK
jgi:UDP-3-O-[3-hydroxymyristoyl] glucosamine N-acyltransferase